MSYAKRPLSCQDFFVGINEVNGAIANAAAIQDGWAAEHRASVADGGPATGTPLPAGRHDDVLIPRTVLQVVVTSYSSAVAGGAQNYTLGIYGPTYLASVQRIETGLWFIGTRYMGVSPWAEVEPIVAASGTVRIAKTDWQASFNEKAGFLVQTLGQASAGAAFTAEDYSFDLRIFSR